MFTGFLTSPISFAEPENFDKELSQLEKDRRIYDEKYQNLQQKITILESTYNELKNSDISADKLKEIKEQLQELKDDLADHQESEIDLLEREESFAKKWSTQSNNAITTNEPASIPPWFKSNAKWWIEGLITDADIVNALESLIIQDVIPLDSFLKKSSGIEHTAGVQKGGDLTIPSYQKDVFGYWSEGLVSDDEIVNSIGYLMTEGIINSAKIQSEIAERKAKFDQKMASLDSVLSIPSNPTKEKFNDDGTSTIVNADGSVTMHFPDGSYTQFFKDGSRYTSHSDDVSNGISWKAVKGTFTEADGTVTRIYDDSTVTYFDDGSYVIYGTESGTITKHIPYGKDNSKKYEINSDEFLSSTTSEDGITTKYSDGTVVDVYKSGEVIIKDPNGKKTTIHPSMATFNPFGEGAVKWPAGYVIEQGNISNFNDDVGMMTKLSQVTALVIDGIQFPISQFAMWKWTGECDDAWHYHTPTTQAISIDGETGIIDPDQENCGFGKVGEVQVTTTFMSPEQIKKFRDLTDSDPLTNEAMMGGSDDGTNTVNVDPKPAESPVDVNPGPVSAESSDDDQFILSKTATSPYDIEFPDADGDGIGDNIDDEPNKKSTKFGTNGNGLPGEIIDAGDLNIAIIGSEDFGAIIIEVGTDGDSESVIINVLGVDLEIEAGSILEIAFG